MSLWSSGFTSALQCTADFAKEACCSDESNHIHWMSYQDVD